MSLKAFHIVFVTVSTLFCAGFSLWALTTYRAEGELGLLAASLLGLVGCVTLVVYGRWFLRKLKGVSYL